MSKQKVFLIGSSYGLLLALLAFPVSSDDLFVFNGDVVSKRITNELSKDHIVYVRNSNSSCKNKIEKILNVLKEEKKYRKYLKKMIKESPVIIGHDHILAISYPFWGKFNTIIEDGYINYLGYTKILALMKKKGSQYYKILRFLYKLKTGNDYKLYGYDLSISKVLLTDSSKEVPELNEKKMFCSVDALWNVLSSENKKRIIEIFQIPKLTKEIYKNNNVILLITQPLSEDGLMTEKEKIDLYSSVLIEKKAFFIIKPHPREKTNYHKLFPSTFVIDNDIPLEAIALIGGKNISEIYTCFSTAANIFKNKAKINYIPLLKYPNIVRKYNLYDIQTK